MKLIYSKIDTRLPAGNFAFKSYLWLAGKIKIPFSQGEYLDVYTIDGFIKLSSIKKLLHIGKSKRIIMIFNEGTKWQYVIQNKFTDGRYIGLNHIKFKLYGEAEYIYHNTLDN
jgi:hypothetical protein